MPVLLDLYKDDHKREEGKRLDEYQAENHRRADGRRRSGIARHAFTGRRSNAALPERTAKGGKSHAETSGDCKEPFAIAAGFGMALAETSGDCKEPFAPGRRSACFLR